ncbi:N-acetylmuramoyl-L-alanine amidase family protein [Sphingomicrobium sediminis]|uniref:N-acetylmuramoyl-L-alanine amidase n=1 Tax=Sphingomicrobium sediminis TaxID=2950949 RepID=A0A9X2J248_9SPHN|nr:N-acetylmuramoyl-L-alanine amidase [Sphingomicrobium sediminis]MCM8557439.1 N-acetylmuramoyl-L-alanine amidase [Sphingomicrobium sediminis]
MSRARLLVLAIIAAAVFGAGWLLLGGRAGDADEAQMADNAILGEARRGGVRLELPDAVGEIDISEARTEDALLVLIDPGHGGRDGGARGASGRNNEKALTLAMAEELRDRLADAGRVRVALTRTGDDTLTLDQRPAIARAIGADLFVSIHMDAAPNAEATGVTIYSLSDVASTVEAARLADAERERVGAVVSDADAPVEFILTDLALRDQMAASAAFARRLLRFAEESGDVPLRPTPHQFANFYVLRFAQTPGVLVEAGYVTNTADEARLSTKEGRAPLVEALARAIEADLATRGL